MQKFKPFETSSIWEFIDPDTGFRYQAQDRPSLIKYILSYRTQNKLPPIEYITDVVDNYLCALPINCGKCVSLPLKRGFFTYVKGAVSLLQNLYYGDDNIVSQEQADRRAAQCVTCKYNSFPDKSTFIKWSDDLAEASVGTRRTSSHPQLGNCNVCSCCLKAKVWYKGPFIISTQEASQMQEVDCWQIKNEPPEKTPNKG